MPQPELIRGGGHGRGGSTAGGFQRGRVEAAGEPDPDKDGVVRWRCVDLKRVIKERFDVDLDEVSVGRVLKELGFAHVSPRPKHPEQDPQAIEAFKKLLRARGRALKAKALPANTPIEIWFQDEMRVGQKNGLVYQWAKKGTRPRQLSPADYFLARGRGHQ